MKVWCFLLGVKILAEPSRHLTVQHLMAMETVGHKGDLDSRCWRFVSVM